MLPLKKSLLSGALALTFLAPAAFCQPFAASSPGLDYVTATSSTLRSPDELDKLLAPIALYPDELLATILPAAAATTDLVMASRFVQQNGANADFDTQPWDDSVKALAHYPEVLAWMDQNLPWTQQLGDAFATQSDAVMNAVQRLRARAMAAGTLATTPQQQVIVTGGVIEIVPAQPNVIYVPRYDPEVVYDEPATDYVYNQPYITFGPAFSAGAWFGYDFDWREHRVWVINRDERERYWRDHRGGRTPFEGRPGDHYDSHRSPWHPPPGRPGIRDDRPHPSGPVAPPRPLNGTPPRPQNFHPANPARPYEQPNRSEPNRPDDRNRFNEPNRSDERARDNGNPGPTQNRGNVTATREQPAPNPAAGVGRNSAGAPVATNPPTAKTSVQPLPGQHERPAAPARVALPVTERDNPAARPPPMAMDPRSRPVEQGPRPAPAPPAPAPVAHFAPAQGPVAPPAASNPGPASGTDARGNPLPER